MRFLLLILLILSPFLNPAFAQSLSGPPLSGANHGYIEFEASYLETGEPFYHSKIEIERKANSNGHYDYKMLINLILAEGEQVHYDARYRQDQSFYPTQAEYKKTNLKEKNTVLYRKYHFEKTQIKMIDLLQQYSEEVFIDDTIYPSESIALVLMGIDFDKTDLVKLKVLLQPKSIYTLSVRKLKEKWIETPFGKILCNQLEIRPDLGFFNYLIGFAIPSIYYWQKKEAPRIPIQYSGPSEGPWSKHIVAKIVRYSH